MMFPLRVVRSTVRLFFIYLASLILAAPSVKITEGASVTIGWSPPTTYSDGAPLSPAGYKVHVGQGSELYTSSYDVGNQTTATISDLEAGPDYYMAVSTYDGQGSESDYSQELVWESKVATPAIAPAGGTYTGPVTVSISTSSEGAHIRYTVDGSAPNEQSTLYTAPIEITQATTLRAVAYKNSSEPSDIVVATFTFDAQGTPPVIVSQPTSLTVVEPEAAHFVVEASGSSPLSYQWRRNNVPIPGATGANYTLTPTDHDTHNGNQFDVEVSNSFGSVVSSPATLSVGLLVDKPTELVASTLSSSEIRLTWKDNSNGEDGFKIDRSEDNLTWTRIATPAANDTSYLDTGLSANTKRYYRIKAYQGSTNSEYSNTADATTLAAAPEKPAQVVATASSANEINITWIDRSDNEVGFRLKRTQDSGATWQLAADLSENTVSYSDTGLTEATTYQYKIMAVGIIEHSRYTLSNQATTFEVTTSDPAPETPTEVVATASSATEINIAWTDQSDNEVGFRLKRTQDSGATWQSIAEHR